MGRKKQELMQLSRVAVSRVAVPEELAEQTDDYHVDVVAQSLLAEGLREPVLVQRMGADGRHELVVGAERVLAAQRLGWQELDAIVLGPEHQPELDVVRRMQREEVDPWELADALQSLKRKCKWTQAHLGVAIGRTRDFVANILAITQIAPEVRRYIVSHNKGHELTARHLRYVARAARSEQLRIAQRILGSNLSTTELEREKRGTGGRNEEYRFIRVRDIRKPGAPHYPRTFKEWRKYYRQLNTDLRRIDRQESEETRRAQARQAEAKQRQRLVRKEANKKRRELERELRHAVKQLSRLGSA